MRLKAETDYAIRFVVYLAEERRMCSSREISDAMHVPREYLFQVAMHLRRAGIVIGKSGVHGGYALRKPPSEISVRDIIEALSDMPMMPNQNKLSKISDSRSSETVEDIYRWFETEARTAFSKMRIDQFIGWRRSYGPKDDQSA